MHAGADSAENEATLTHIARARPLCVCLNDHVPDVPTAAAAVSAQLAQFMEDKFPRPSCFELTPLPPVRSAYPLPEDEPTRVWTPCPWRAAGWCVVATVTTRAARLAVVLAWCTLGIAGVPAVLHLRLRGKVDHAA
eukprot:TRINITY_DN2783_c0_g1_i3.p3 TRINITY_DN2783_c0_g1~~TRINITY_DN2783_c0_g1_i3.p3  ORF type:complete len:136 (-),score=26.84 TRINITY_DN2783_c0_g1_i3:71-478(-)